nr:MAG TPA: hypothetical protein [Caudoviricetes sp.]
MNFAFSRYSFARSSSIFHNYESLMKTQAATIIVPNVGKWEHTEPNSAIFEE